MCTLTGVIKIPWLRFKICKYFVDMENISEDYKSLIHYEYYCYIGE